MQRNTREYLIVSGGVSLVVDSEDRVEEVIRKLFEVQGNINVAVSGVFGEAKKRLKVLQDVTVPRVDILPQTLHVSFPWAENLSFYVRRPSEYNMGKLPEALVVVRNGIEYGVRRGGTGGLIDGHYAMASHSGRVVLATLIVHVVPQGEVSNDPLLDRGVCWVSTGNPAEVSFNLEHLQKHLAKGEISEMVRRVEARVREDLNDIYRRSRKRRAQAN